MGLVEWYDAFYVVPAVFSILLGITSIYISKDLDGDAQLILDMDLRSRLRYNLKQIK